MATDLELIAEARDNGFMNAVEIMKSWDWGNYAWHGIFFWIRGAGEDAVVVVPDGPTDIRKSQRVGLYPDSYAEVTAYKDAWYARHRQKEWRLNMEQVDAAIAEYGLVTDLMDWGVHKESMGPCPPDPDQSVFDRVDARKAAKRAAEVAEDKEREQLVKEVMRDWLDDDEPVNRRGFPPTRKIRDRADVDKLAHGEKRRWWKEVVQEDARLADELPQ